MILPNQKDGENSPTDTLENTLGDCSTVSGDSVRQTVPSRTQVTGSTPQWKGWDISRPTQRITSVTSNEANETGWDMRLPPSQTGSIWVTSSTEPNMEWRLYESLGKKKNVPGLSAINWWKQW